MAQSPEAQMLGLEQQRIEIEKQKLEISAAKELTSSALKNRELTLEEAELQLNMFKAGADMSSKKVEKQKDRDTKMAIAALEGLLDLAKTSENINRDKALKAADVLSKFVDTQMISKE